MMLSIGEDDCLAAKAFGIPDEYLQRVYACFLGCDLPEDGWWMQPFDEWLQSWESWQDLRQTFFE